MRKNKTLSSSKCLRPVGCSQTKIPEGAKSFAMKSTRQDTGQKQWRAPISEVCIYIGCKAKRQRVKRDGVAIDGTIAPNAPAWLRAWVHNNFERALLLPSREENINSLGAAVQHNFRRTLLLPSREENINSLGAAVQHNFRRTLLVPSRDESINSLGVAVQHNSRRTLLVPSREENIKRISTAWAPRYRCLFRLK